VRIIEIEWDEETIEHIWTHGVEPEEVEEVLRGRYLLQTGKRHAYYLLGQSYSGRYLFTVLRQRSSGRYRVLTARDMTRSERKRFTKKVK